MGELEVTARSLLALAERALVAQPADALTAAEGAGSVARSIGASELELSAERLAARIAYALGDLSRAEQHFTFARNAAHAVGDPLNAARIDASLAFLAYDRGRSAEAHATLDGVEAVLSSLDPSEQGVGRLSALVAGYRGNLARQGGALEDARHCYRVALRGAAEHQAEVFSATFAMDLGATELAARQGNDAAFWLAQAERATHALAPGSARALLAPLVAHYQALHLLGSGKGGPSLVEIEGPASLLPVRRWLYDATQGGKRAARVTTSLRRRLIRMQEDAVPYEHARFGVAFLLGLSRFDSDESAVVVARDGSLLVRGSLVGDFSSREPLRRLLEGLIVASAEQRPLDLPHLLALGWPGERMGAAAAKNRVHVALSTLRSAGLGAVLLRVGSGYLLDAQQLRIR